jgi:hypothetical protein
MVFLAAFYLYLVHHHEGLENHGLHRKVSSPCHVHKVD